MNQRHAAAVLAFGVAGWAVAGLAAPPPTQEQVQEAERSRAALLQQQKAAQARSAAALAEEARLAAERVVAARALRDLETQSAAAADRVSDLVQRREEARAGLARRAADLAPFLPIIERLALYPSETLLAVPMPAEQSVRGILVLGGLTRELEQEAASLRAEQDRLASISAALDTAIPELAARQAAQSVQATALDAQIEIARSQRRQADGDATAAARRAAAEAARASSLRAAIVRLEAERAAEAHQAAIDAAAKADARQHQEAEARPQQEAAARPIGAFSALASPVAGMLVRNFGDPLDGGTSTGVAYQAPPSARVVAPCGGHVVFSGPFRSFGLLVILDCGGGYHAVLSGFERLDAALGQAVQQGEPIGAMPGWDPIGQQRRPQLNLELRRGGEPINPAPFLRGRG